jgi:myo-inositol-1(or 4)-monophosphatase
MELARLTAIAHDIAAEAGALVMQGYRASVAATEKGRADLVTAYDVASEKLIRARLQALTPEIAIVGEEQGGAEHDGPTWYCDPIDGTTNFVHGHPFFCVCIGLFDRGEALAGAVVAPALGVSWTGNVEEGARRNGAPCRVSETGALSAALVATGFHPSARGKPSEDNLASHAAVMSHVRDIRRCGSAALDLCFVADGTYDAYWERLLMPWDVIGGAAIVLAAGGRVTALDGSAPELRRGHIVASNGKVHDELVRVLAAT